MAPPAYWKSSLKLSLVTCPIALYPASSQAEKTHFHHINTKTGHRLKQQMVDEQTGRVVDKDHKGRGYELSKGRYVEIDEEELEAVKLESTHTIEIDDFVPAEDRYRSAISRQAILHRARRKSGCRCVRGYPRCDEAKGQSGARARRALEQGACHCTETAGQKVTWNDAALSLRIEGPGRLFRRYPQSEDIEGHGRSRGPYPRYQGVEIRSAQI